MSPTYNAAADFNGDGFDDVLLIDYNLFSCCQIPFNISIAYGQKDGTFRESPPVATVQLSGNPYAIIPGDFNGDGRPDFVVVDDYYYTSFINNGDGTFRQVEKGTLANTFGRTAIGDFNGDGKLDFVIAVQDGPPGPLYLVQGRGDGTFEAPKAIGLPGNYVLEVEAADLNGDGHPDLVYQNAFSPATPETEQVRILLNDGHGNFTDSVPSAIAPASGPFTIGDFNNDGIPDLFAAVPDSNAVAVGAVFFGVGDGTFVSGHLGVPLYDNFLLSTPMVAGDFDGDGLIDVAVFRVVTGPYQLLILWNEGGGDFSGQIVPTNENFGAWTGDVNGDGITDIVQPGRMGMVTPVLGRSDRRIDGGVPMFPLGSGVLTSGDINGDGAAEVLLSGADGYYSHQGSLFQMKADGTFRRMALTPPGGQKLADIDGDGAADLVGVTDQLGSTSNLVTIWRGDQTGNFTQIVAQVPLPLSQAPPAYQIIDLDKDGHLDIVISGVILYGRGNFQFDVVSEPDTENTAFGIGDFDGDGILDLYTLNGIIFGAGNRKFLALKTLSIPQGSVMKVGDMNGDGKDDLVVGDSNFNSVGIYLSMGRSGFQFSQGFTIGDVVEGNVGSICLGDFNADGKLDIAAATIYTNSVAIFTSNSRGSYDMQRFATGVVGSSCIVADVNGDGKPDLVLQDEVPDYKQPNAVAIVHR